MEKRPQSPRGRLQMSHFKLPIRREYDHKINTEKAANLQKREAGNIWDF